ncbi:MAG: PHP domain-containing protein [Oscillospiraceae bacterium]|nr:PHP domain-containing protein [Oscillospiraceae bacterium]
MSHFIDLHTHSSASDGTDAPEALIESAKKAGLGAIAITDHDCFGSEKAFGAAEKEGIEFVPGIEVSIGYPPPRGRIIEDEGIHILGLFINPEAPALKELLCEVVAEREDRNEKIARAMRDDGLPVFLEDLKKNNPGAVIGRPHFGAALVKCGAASDMNDAFFRYLNPTKKYFRKREYIEKQRCFDVIHASGGIPVIAHPLQYKYPPDEFEAFIRDMKSCGAEAMECVYTGYGPGQQRLLMSMAKRFELLPSGGSDYHGSKKSIKLGGAKVPYEYLEGLKDRLRR